MQKNLIAGLAGAAAVGAAVYAFGSFNGPEYISAARINVDTGEIISNNRGMGWLNCYGDKREGDIESVSFNGSEREFQPLADIDFENAGAILRSQDELNSYFYAVREAFRADPGADPFLQMDLEPRDIDEFWAFSFPFGEEAWGAVAHAENDAGVKYTLVGTYVRQRELDRPCSGEKLKTERENGPQPVILIIRVDPAAKHAGDRAVVWNVMDTKLASVASLTTDSVASAWLEEFDDRSIIAPNVSLIPFDLPPARKLHPYSSSGAK